MGKIPVGQYDELTEAMQAGHASIKIFTTDITPSRAGRMVRFGEIWEALKTVAKAGGSPPSMPRTTTSSCTCTRS